MRQSRILDGVVGWILDCIKRQVLDGIGGWILDGIGRDVLDGLRGQVMDGIGGQHPLQHPLLPLP